MKGDEVTAKLFEDAETAKLPIVYMSGFGADLQSGKMASHNVIGFLNKPFTSDLLIKTVEEHIPKSPEEPEPIKIEAEPAPPPPAEDLVEAEPLPVFEEHIAPPEIAPPEPLEEQVASPESAPAEPLEEQAASPEIASPEPKTPVEPQPAPSEVAEPDWAQPASTAPLSGAELPDESITGGPYFCGDTRFFSINRALQTIAKEKLTGWLRSFWPNGSVELLAQNGQIVLATTRDVQLYCPDAPITLVNVDPERIEAARNQQSASGCPLFLTLAQEGLILREPAVQLVQHYGQKLFAQLWTAPYVRFLFERNQELPTYASETVPEPDVDHWALASLRFLQFQDLGAQSAFSPGSIPAYTKDGFERVQNLKLTVAEAQFASQFNGVRSTQQIARNLRLDLKFARLTLFRFLALEIVECWLPTTAAKPEKKSIFQRLTRSIGGGE